jgi:hypothetical protein
MADSLLQQTATKGTCSGCWLLVLKLQDNTDKA